MTITEIPTAARISHKKVTDNNNVTHYVFLCADGKYGNSIVGFGYPTIEAVAAAMSKWSTKSEWPGIARGIRSGKL